MRQPVLQYSILALALIGTNSVFCEEADLRFSSIQSERTEWANEIVLGDVNGDVNLDALIGFGKYFGVWVGDGKGNFTEQNRFSCDNVRNVGGEKGSGV